MECMQDIILIVTRIINKLFKKKPIVIHAYTNIGALYEYAQLKSATRHKPEWWKNLPALKGGTDDNWFNSMNMKVCSGFNDLYKKSVTIPMWSDVDINIGKVGSGAYEYLYADKMSSMNSHNPIEWGGFFDDENYQHIKLHTPWILDCEEDVDFIMTPDMYSGAFPADTILPVGVLNFSKTGSCNVNVVFKRHSEDVKHLIEFGRSIAMLIPMSDRKVLVKHHLISNDEYDQLFSRKNAALTFKGKHYRMQSCPFKRK